MKTIANIASITDNSGAEPMTFYSNAVQTFIRTDDCCGTIRCKIVCECRRCCCCDCHCNRQNCRRNCCRI